MQELGRMIKKLCSKLFSRIVITGVLILIQAAWFWSLFTSLSSYAHWLNPLMIALSVIMCAVLIRQDSTAPGVQDQLDGSFHDHAGAGRFALPAVGR